ncbi:MAG: glycosyltransferase family 4 protein [Chloroflexota bacterium]|nr:glycosyltransferase family 4 protein [Chloroflexota bacterium]
MKLLFVGAGQSPHMHGWEAYFVKAGHTVHLLTLHLPNMPSGVGEPGVRVHYLPGQRLLAGPHAGIIRSLWAALYIFYLVRRYRIDVVHAHQVIPYGFWGALSRSKPLVVTAWGSDLLTEPYASRRAMRYVHFTLSRAQLLTADSRHLLAAALKHGLKAPGMVVQLGVDTTEFTPGDKKLARSELGLDPDVPLVLSPRSLTPVYNIDTVISSVPLVLSRIPSAFFIIKYWYGGGHEVALQRQVERLEVAHRVRFVGPVETEDIISYYTAADVCVSVASSDSSPKSVLEAMACGTPVVLSDLPWVHEHIEDEREALLVPPRDHYMLAESTVRLLNDDGLRGRLAAAGREMVLRHADYNRSMLQMNELYKALLARKPL